MLKIQVRIEEPVKVFELVKVPNGFREHHVLVIPVVSLADMTLDSWNWGELVIMAAAKWLK